MFLASLAHETKQIVLGTGTINMPNAHPAGDRGAGGDARSHAAGPLHHGHQPGRADVGRRGVRQLPEGPQRDLPRVDQHGARDLEAATGPTTSRASSSAVTTANTMIPEIGQGTILKPYQKPHPPIVVTAVAPHSKGVTEAAKRGWTPISANFLLPEWVASHWPRYVRRAARRSARRPTRPTGASPSPSSSPTTRTTAQRYGTSPEGPYHFYFKQLIRKLVGAGGRAQPVQARPERARRGDHARPRDAEARDRRHGRTAWSSSCSPSGETTGDFGTLLYACHDWVDPALGRRSMQLHGRAGDAPAQRRAGI